MNTDAILDKCQRNLVGLDSELMLILSAIKNKVPVMIEGESGTGKTELAKTLAEALERPFFRVDGDENLNISKIRGWFDPPLVMKMGFCEKSFIPGPLIRAMKEGGLFFFNEVNRAPSESLNGVLAAMDERSIDVPQLHRFYANDNFYTIFTLNPQEYVGTNPLPEAFFDRCVLIKLDHKSGKEAERIVKLRTGCNDEELISKIVRFTDMTRKSSLFERGASIRAAIHLTLFLKDSELIPEITLPSIYTVYAGKVKPHPDANKSVLEYLHDLAIEIFFPDSKKE
ncbi:MAG: AAA family ATPase [Candidatus Hodarchaeales archaeon]